MACADNPSRLVGVAFVELRERQQQPGIGSIRSREKRGHETVLRLQELLHQILVAEHDLSGVNRR